MRTYLAGKTKINWKKNTWKVVNKLNGVPTSSLYTRPIYEFWEKYARQLRSIQMYKSKVNYFFTVLLYTISKTISWAKNKMGHLLWGEKNGQLRKQITHKYVALILQLISHRSFQKHKFFLQFLLYANKNLC